MIRKILKRVIITLCFIMLVVATGTMAETNEKNKLNDINRITDVNKIWKVSFTKIIDLSSLGKESVYIEDFYGNKLDNINIEIENDKTILVDNEDEYLRDTIYKLVIDKSVGSYDGQTLGEDHEMYFEVESEIKSSFIINEIYKYSKNAIYIEFSEEIDEKAEIPLFYEIINDKKEKLSGSYKNIEVKLVGQENKAILIKIKDKEFEINEGSAVKISGELVSKKETQYNDGSVSWKAINTDSEKVEFKIESAEFLGTRILEVKFNRPLWEGGVSKSNIKVYNPDGKELKVKETHVFGEYLKINLEKALDDLGEFKVRIKYIRDITGESRISNKDYKIKLDGIKENYIEYTMNVINQNMVEVIFKDRIEKISAYEKFNYLINESGKTSSMIPKKIYYNEDEPNKIKLYYYVPLKKGKVYYMVVSKYVKNSFGENYDYDSKKKLNGVSNEYDFDVDETIVGANTIEIKFSHEMIQEDWTLNTDLYTLFIDEGNGRKITIECSNAVFKDSKTLLLTFEGMNGESEYKLKLPKFEGYFGDEFEEENGILINR